MVEVTLPGNLTMWLDSPPFVDGLPNWNGVYNICDYMCVLHLCMGKSWFLDV